MPDETASRLPSGLQRRMFLAGALGLCAAGAVAPVRAATTMTAAAADTAASPSDPTAAIQSFEATLLTIMKAGSAAPFVHRFNTLAPVVDRTFDLETILRNSVGLPWPGLSAVQRSALLATFRRYTIASWVANFNVWSGQQFTISTSLRHVGNEVVVPTELVPRSGSPTSLSFVMQQGTSGWRVVDVLVEGSISRVAVQRSDFRSLLTNGGVPALMASLQRKISSLSDGSLA